MDNGLQPWKLKIPNKTRFAANKVIMFEKTLEFKAVILLCYGNRKTLSLQQQVPKAQVWAIVEVVTTCSNPMVFTCVLNKFKGH
jgi:hypothetical protein